MRRALTVALAIAALSAACGARTSAGEDTAGAGSTTAPRPHPPCASADGIRLCGGTAACPALPAPTCPGYGCTPAYTVEGPSSAGVCWADAPDHTARRCPVCEEGEVCVQRGRDLYCTSRDLCDALLDLGARGTCRFTDMTVYDGRPFAEASACPAERLCGGGCGACRGAYSTEYACVGRSAQRALGVCESLVALLPRQCGSCNLDEACGVYPGVPADHDLRRRHGVCIEGPACRALIPTLGWSCE